MDNNKLVELISHEVGHALEHAIDSPEVINRVVGESMRHIGSFLNMSSTSYLPIRKEEILVIPEILAPGSHDAVLLIKRALTSENAFQILATGKTEDGVRRFSFHAYQQDHFNLGKTKFINLPKEVGDEIIRQLGQLVQGDGAVMVQCVVAKNYFPATNQEAPAPAPASTPAAASNALPPVSTENLL